MHTACARLFKPINFEYHPRPSSTQAAAGPLLLKCMDKNIFPTLASEQVAPSGRDMSQSGLGSHTASSTEMNFVGVFAALLFGCTLHKKYQSSQTTSSVLASTSSLPSDVAAACGHGHCQCKRAFNVCKGGRHMI